MYIHVLEREILSFVVCVCVCVCVQLLDLFPEEGGQKNKKERMIPFLPGKNYPRILSNRNNRELAEKRLPELHRYAK